MPFACAFATAAAAAAALLAWARGEARGSGGGGGGSGATAGDAAMAGDGAEACGGTLTAPPGDAAGTPTRTRSSSTLGIGEDLTSRWKSSCILEASPPPLPPEMEVEGPAIGGGGSILAMPPAATAGDCEAEAALPTGWRQLPIVAFGIGERSFEKSSPMAKSAPDLRGSSGRCERLRRLIFSVALQPKRRRGAKQSGRGPTSAIAA